jgi:WD40 repeat protein
MPRTECLTAAELAAFHLGDLPETDLLELAGHLERCPRCEQEARALDGLSDATLAAYRQSARAGPLPPGDALPRRVGDYEPLETVGRGGMGVVYKARHVRLRRVVALKMLLGGYFADGDQRARFRTEAEAVARLQHPHIVQLFESGEHEADAGLPRPYFTLEFVAGGSLAQRLAGRPLAPRQAAVWLEPVARAAHFAHERGIIHRDLKPSNILLTGDGQPKICDFGVAKLAEGSDFQTLSGMLIGTVEYMAPEQAEGKAAPEPATDVYALGAILYEMLTGRPPFKGASTLDTLNQVRAQEPVPPRHLQPLVPRDLETVCLKCLEKDPRRRYASALALAEDLRRFLAGEPVTARPVSDWERAAKWCRRRPAQAALAAALVAVTLLGLAGVTWQLLRAEAARQVAIQEKEAAFGERTRAVQLAEELRTQRDAAEWQTYRANIAAAASALQLHNAYSARQFLNDAPAKHRGWEYGYFHSQLDLSQADLHGHQGLIHALAFSPDGKRLASGSLDQTLRVWDAATGHPVAVSRRHGGGVECVAFGPNGTRLAYGTNDGTVGVWDVTTGNEATFLRGTNNPPSHTVFFLAFSLDGARLGAGTADGKVHVWDAATGQALFVRHDPRAYYRALALSPDGKRIAAGTPDGLVHLWDAENGREVGLLRGQTVLPVQGAFSPDGTRLVTSGQAPDNTLRLWNASTGQPIAALVGHRDQVLSVSFSPDGSRIVSTSSDRTARLWDGTTGKPAARLAGHAADVSVALFSPDGMRLMTASEDQTIRLWNTTTGECMSVLHGHEGPVRVLALSPDGSRLASAAAETTVRLWDMRLAERTGVLRGHTDIVFDVAFSPDGAQVVSAAWDGSVRFWDAATGRQTGLLQHDEDHCLSSVALSPDGKQVASVARYAHRGHLWDVATGTHRYILPLPAPCHVQTRCAFHPKGTIVAAAGQEGSVHLWGVTTGEHIAQLQGHAGYVSDVAFSPDGLHLASSGEDSTVRIWDVATRQALAVLWGHVGLAFSVTYSADGRLIASAGVDRTVRLWDAQTHAPVGLLRHGDMVLRVRFSPDGKRLAAACHDNTLRLWDVARREEVAELRGHAAYVYAVAWSPDGTRLASASGDLTVRIWDTLPPRERARARKGD